MVKCPTSGENLAKHPRCSPSGQNMIICITNFVCIYIIHQIIIYPIVWVVSPLQASVFALLCSFSHFNCATSIIPYVQTCKSNRFLVILFYCPLCMSCFFYIPFFAASILLSPLLLMQISPLWNLCKIILIYKILYIC